MVPEKNQILLSRTSMMKQRLPRLAISIRPLPAVLLFVGGLTCGLAVSHLPYWLERQTGTHKGFIQVSGDGLQEWFLKGCRHRIGGPAVLHPNGRKEWWEHGHFIRAESPQPPPVIKPGQTTIYQ